MTEEEKQNLFGFIPLDDEEDWMHRVQQPNNK
jgi:hypothetical protein